MQLLLLQFIEKQCVGTLHQKSAVYSLKDRSKVTSETLLTIIKCLPGTEKLSH